MTPAAGTDPASKLCLFPGEKHWVRGSKGLHKENRQWSCWDLWRRSWEHWDPAMGSRGCFSVCRGEGWAPSQAHSAPAARVQHPFPSGNDGLQGHSWGQASLTSPGGSTGKVLETHRGSSPETATAALPVVLGSSRHCDTVAWCPCRDFSSPHPAKCIKTEADSGGRAVTSQRAAGKSTQQRAPGHFFMGFTLLREWHLSPSVGHSSYVDIWAPACSRRIVFLWRTGCFQPCAEPVPIEQLMLLK